MPQGFIRITSRPKGGAPATVRDRWIGLVLPVEQKTDAHLEDVLTHRLITDRRGGYQVLWSDAMNVLGEHDANTRKWWEENVHGFPTLIFDEDCCEPVPD